MANEPTFNPNVYREFDEAARRNRAVQDLYEPGSTFKVVTASAAIEEKVMPLDTLIDTNPGQIRIDRTRVVRDVSNHGVLSFDDVIVESSNVGAIKIGFKVGTERLSQYVAAIRLRPVGVAGFSRRERGHRVAARQVDRERARVGVDGLSDRRHAAADGRGGQLGRQRRRVRRAARRPRGLPGQPAVRGQAEGRAPHDHGGHGGRPHVDHGRRRRARHGEAGADSRVHDRGEDGHGREARQRQLLARATTTGRLSASCRRAIRSSRFSSSLDSPHGPHGYYGGSVSAPIFKRIAEETLRYLGVGPTINPAPPVLVAGDRTRSDVVGVRRRGAASIVTVVRRRPAGHDAGSAGPERARCAAPAGQAGPDGRACRATASSSRRIRRRARRSTRSGQCRLTLDRQRLARNDRAQP